MWTAGSWLLNLDNAPAHTVLPIRQFLAKHSIPNLPQPPYSPDLSPPDFFLFPKLKFTLKGRRFQTVEDIITNVTNDLKVIPQTSFKQCFQK
jgi:histone-lysine N-methyltransferase SETMAR